MSKKVIFRKIAGRIVPISAAAGATSGAAYVNKVHNKNKSKRSTSKKVFNYSVGAAAGAIAGVASYGAFRGAGAAVRAISNAFKIGRDLRKVSKISKKNPSRSQLEKMGFQFMRGSKDIVQ